MLDKEKQAVVIYDGNCPICKGIISWLKAQDKNRALEMISCHSASSCSTFSFLNKESCRQAMQLILPDERVLSGEQAFPEILKRLSRYDWLASIFSFPIFKPLLPFLYSWFAPKRYIFSGLLRPYSKRH